MTTLLLAAILSLAPLNTAWENTKSAWNSSWLVVEGLREMVGLLPAATYRITAYTPDDHCAPDDPGYKWCDGLTASMVPADPQLRIVACPRQISFHTKVYIQGLGIFTCLDRGGAIKGLRLDVLVETKEQAYEITGQRTVLILTQPGGTR